MGRISYRDVRVGSSFGSVSKQTEHTAPGTKPQIQHTVEPNCTLPFLPQMYISKCYLSASTSREHTALEIIQQC